MRGGSTSGVATPPPRTWRRSLTSAAVVVCAAPFTHARARTHALSHPTPQADDDGDTATFLFEGKKGERFSEFELKLMDIDAEHLGIPETGEGKGVLVCAAAGEGGLGAASVRLVMNVPVRADAC